MLMLLLLRPARAPACLPVTFKAIADGVMLTDDGYKKKATEAPRRIDVASTGMVDGADCSAADPCWIAASSALGVTGDDGSHLQSTQSRNLLGFLMAGAAVTDRNADHLLMSDLLKVLWAMCCCSTPTS